MTRINTQILVERFIFALCRLATLAGIFILAAVIFLLFWEGKAVLSWRFLLSAWNHSNIGAGGIFPAILGSIYLGLGVMLVSFPLGIATAVFLCEYGAGNEFSRVLRLAIRNLAGVPSVVYGIFGFAVFVHYLSFGTSLLSAILTLSVMTLPWVITASVSAIEAVPRSYRESGWALGAGKWQTLHSVVLPIALPGCLTGGVIGIARALGETAPIIMVGATFYLSRLPTALTDKFMALPYHTYILSTQHSSPQAIAYAAGTALVLMLLTFVLSLGAILARYFMHNKMRKGVL